MDASPSFAAYTGGGAEGHPPTKIHTTAIVKK